MTTNPPVFEVRQVRKAYGSVVAANSIDLEIRGGELLALIGDNGAGKSTLVKILAGALAPDSGELLHRGEVVTFSSARDARERGIETVFQDLALAPLLDVADNLYLGREIVYRMPLLPRALRPLNRRAMARGAATRLQELAITLPSLSLAIERLSGGQRQAVAVARAAGWAADVLLLDEPTAALGVQQSEAVLSLTRRLVDTGMAVVLITHNLPHVIEHADRVVVLRQGRKVGDLAGADATPERLVSLMVGFEERTAAAAADDES